VQPGKGTGAPGPATTAPTGSNGGAAVTIIVGSGADNACAPYESRPSSRRRVRISRVPASKGCRT
jgi:hypothetical protein